MNAIQFIQQHEIDKAREVVDNHHECYMPEVFKYWSEQLHDYVLAPKYASFLVSDLKRLVDSVDLIGKYHSIDHAKNHYNNMREALNQYQYENKDIDDLSNELKQAIADYESIYSNDMGDDTRIENHVSPLCKVGVK